VSKLTQSLIVLVCAVSGLNTSQAQSTYERYAFKTVAGLAGEAGSVDGAASDARFNHPSGAAVDSAGNIYVGDSNNNTIRKITPTGVVSTLAGLPGSQGSDDGTGSAARFFHPYGITVAPDDNIYVADLDNHTIRKVTPAGVVTTLAGEALSQGSADGTGNAARFRSPISLAADTAGNIYVADGNNCTIRKITPAGVVTTLAGSAGSCGYADGNGSAARFDLLRGVAVDGAGNVYVADTFNYTIRKISPNADVTTLAGLPGTMGSADGTGSAARFNHPWGLASDIAGNLYVADTDNSTIRKVTPAGVVTTLAGLVGTQGSADGAGSAARFNHTIGLTVDTSGNLFVPDGGNQTIRVGTAVSQLLNISTRVRVEIGNNTLIGGFIVTGTGPKQVLIRAIGPSLVNSGVQGFLPDPTLELYDSNGAFIVSNDNWKGAFNAPAIQATGIAPSNDLEAAILVTVNPTPGYTAVVRGKNGATGIGVVELYDLQRAAGSVLANISARGFVQTGDNVMIGGFILGGSTGPTRVIIRALGPSLSQSAIGNPLPDPTLELHDGNGTLVVSNDDWKDDQESEIQATGIPPPDDLESAIVRTLSAGAYTAVVAGKNGDTGIAVVEVYDLE
jgi:sugar lactone lactonase YvrE